MIDYSVDELKEKIFHPKTRNYFEEVIKTYYSECYRSSIVMLYSVVICDLIFKLEDLRDIYTDATAERILEEINRLQIAKPTSSDWETKLVDSIFKETKLLEISDYENINQLHKHRHLSAHPVLNQTSILFEPNKDNVKSHVRNMLEGVLIKPPILSKKIFNEIIIDIADNQDRLPEQKDLKRYLEAKYLRNLRVETINEIFKNFWKLVFKLDNEDCNKNRDVNFKALKVLLENNENEIIKNIQREQSHFDGILKDAPTEYLFDLLFYYPKIYSALSTITKAYIKLEIKNKTNYELLSWFIYDTFSDYLKSIIKKLSKGNSLSIKVETYNKIAILADDYSMQKEILDLSVVIFSKSLDYYAADKHFRYIIGPNLENYSNDQLKDILNAVDSNGQVSGRNAALTDNRKIKEVCDRKLPHTFDYSRYRNFRF